MLQKIFSRKAYQLDKKIYFVFGAVILIAILNAISNALTISKSQAINSEIANVTQPSLRNLNKMNLLVTKSKMLITNWVYLQNNKSDKNALLDINYKEYPEVKSKLSALASSWQDKNLNDSLKKVFEDYEQFMMIEGVIMKNLATFDDYQDPVKRFAAEEALESEITPLCNQLSNKLMNIIFKKNNEATIMQAKMEESFSYLMLLVMGIASLILVSVLFAVMFFSQSIIVPIMKVRNVLLKMSRGELPELHVKRPKNAVGEMINSVQSLIDGLKRTASFAGEIGKGNFQYEHELLSENDVQGRALIDMKNKLSKAYENESRRSRINEGIASVSQVLRKQNDNVNSLCDELSAVLIKYTDAQQAGVFLVDKKNGEAIITISGHYAANKNLLTTKSFDLGEGLIGQCIDKNQKLILKDIDHDLFTIHTGFVESRPRNVILLPLSAGSRVIGLLEIASIHEFTDAQIEFLDRISEPIASGISNLKANLLTQALLEDSRKQAEELAQQEADLRSMNDELIKQSELLHQSQEELKIQQDELKQVNSELEIKAHLLEERNLAIEEARQSLVFKTEQLEQSNKYKSSFLANMSHELRTPLNSILILAKLLADNKGGNLSEKQMEHAKVIHKSGSDLLTLINDILDLSKIESGKIELNLEDCAVKDIANEMHVLFREMATEKGIHYSVNVNESIHTIIHTDRMRTEQILKNLLSNAFKFTDKGGEISLSVNCISDRSSIKNTSLLGASAIIAFEVKDSGIGIPREKQDLVFEAFKQADGSTSRKFGGTGLGLAISKELSQILGGDILLQSNPGQGSLFTLLIPEKTIVKSEPVAVPVDESGITSSEQKTEHEKLKAQLLVSPLADDRDSIEQNNKTILIIEDDPAFCHLLIDFCRLYGYKAVATQQGDEALKLAVQYNPSGIILDMQLPVMDGWMILKQLKADRSLSSIPVHIISVMDKKPLAMMMGATSYLNKPVEKSDLEKLFLNIEASTQVAHFNILIIEENKNEFDFIDNLILSKNKKVINYFSPTADHSIELLKKEKIDCIIINEIFCNNENDHLIERIKSNRISAKIPILLYSNSPEYATSISSEDFSRNVYDKLVTDALIKIEELEKNPAVTDLSESDTAEFLKGKTILIADDDMRNIYALTTILENEGATLICAYDGKDAIEKLESNPSVNIVLMDIMMPVMDGYESMKTIRSMEKYASLPIIAVTAKAMAEDREKCIDAGASDYITKPINNEMLMSKLKVWLFV